MKVLKYTLLPLLFLIHTSSFLYAADLKSIKEITLVVPEARIKKIVKQLMPYRIDPVKGFTGSFRVTDVEDIKLSSNSLSFKTRIYGENISYLTRIGKQTLEIELGNVNSRNLWSVALRYDRKSGTLFVKPHIEGSKNRDKLGRGDFLLDSLLIAMSDVEYPVEVNKLKPLIIKTLSGFIQVDVEVENIYVDAGRVFVEVVPSLHNK